MTYLSSEVKSVSTYLGWETQSREQGYLRRFLATKDDRWQIDFASLYFLDPAYVSCNCLLPGNGPRW